MTYKYHKQGDKYVVTKKDTGEVVGHTNGNKDALKKYLAALHFNTNENKNNKVYMKLTELKEIIKEQIREVLSQNIKESVTTDLGTARDFRVITTPEQRDAVEQKIITFMKKFPTVKYTLIPSKANQTDLILKMTGQKAHSAAFDIKKSPDLKGVKFSPYKPALIPKS